MPKITIGFVAVFALATSGCVSSVGRATAEGLYSIQERLQPLDEKDWMPLGGVSVYSWYQGGHLIPEVFKFNKNYYVPMRYKANGVVTPHSDATLEQLGEKLLSVYPYEMRFRVADNSLDKQPIYFIEKRSFVVSVDPPVMALVPANFGERQRNSRRDVNAGYQSFANKEDNMRLMRRIRILPNWANFLEFSSVIPNVDGIEFVSPFWPKPVSMEVALVDQRLRFHAVKSSAYPGYLEIKPREANETR